KNGKPADKPDDKSSPDPDETDGGDQGELPVLRLTMNRQTTAGEDLRIQWNELGAVTYTLTVSQDDHVIVTVVTADPDTQIRLEAPGTYDVQVVAQFADGKEVSSETFTIEVQ